MSIRVLGISGSLRSKSHNTSALRLAGELMPEGMTLETVDWRAVPLFDLDVLASGLPEPVKTVREQVRAADALLFATPEYNFSVPGVLKNLIDWVSRGEDQPFAGKPVAILSASSGPLGGARVQYDLRKILLFANAMLLGKPEVFIGSAASKFDAHGLCTDESTIKFVRAQMESFQRWIESVRRMHG